MIAEIRTAAAADPEKAAGGGTGAASQAAGASVRWLGQAGFLIEWSGRLVIDPYLSDFLAKKYKGKKFEHHRMMPAPILPGELRGIDFYLCTHRHSDHMDPETLPIAAKNNPEALFVVPASQEKRAIELGVPEDRIIAIEGGETVHLGTAVRGGPRITLEALPSAHEGLERDEQGRYLFLGYIIRFPDFTVYHSGDCVPYQGLAERLSREKRGGGENIDLALLPVNGRDRYRRENGIPGNFTIRESLELCSRAGIPYLIPHHFGMFAFNTVSVEQIREEAERFRKAAAKQGRPLPEMLIPETGSRYEIFTQ